MLILSTHFGHDGAAVVADDYNVLAAVQTERLTRVKGDGEWTNLPHTIDEALRIAGKARGEVDALLVSRGVYPIRYHKYGFFRSLRQVYYYVRGHKKSKGASFWSRYRNIGRVDCAAVFHPERLLADFGLPPSADFLDYGHHAAHALSALHFTDWDDALIYTADGGGDWLFYSAMHLRGGELRMLYGGDESVNHPILAHSVGQAYGLMTKALGYKMNRHEGKLTGLAAFGQPALYDELAKHFWVDENGVVQTDYQHVGERTTETHIRQLADTVSPADAAASIQKLLEDIVLRSLGVYLARTGARRVGLAGGVFANVALNRRIAELPQVDEVFVFPGMGDEGLAVGGLYDFLLRRDGLDAWLARRQRLKNVYWGGAFDDEVESVFVAGGAARVAATEGAAARAAELLAAGKIVALYAGRMEFGPRALGARSILASPADKAVNDTLNARLTRTEFMPFAPYVLEEDADAVFEVTSANRYAMRFMTITCPVREEWRSRIPAVTHVDGTARPQIIDDAEQPLYAAVLRAFKGLTGLPVLVNTSFNAHEEPIINTPAECLRALQDGRVDYVLTQCGLWEAGDKKREL